MDNLLFIPTLNPIILYNPSIVALDKFQTRQFDDYPFEQRSQPWLQDASYDRIWQTTDIIVMQFESEFDPIIIQLVDQYENIILDLPALIGLPNKGIPGTYSFEIHMALTSVVTGCYRIKGTFGTGEGQLIYYSGCQYISSKPIPQTLLIEYWNTRFFKDVLFETGIKFQIRVQGWLDEDNSIRVSKQELYRNQEYQNTILSSKSARNFPAYFGDENGLPVDVTDLIEEIFECNNVTIDDKLVGMADGSKVEYTGEQGYRLRGMKLTLEPGLSRSSRAYSSTADTNKKLSSAILVDARAFGDTSHQGSDNTIPVYNQQTF